MEIEIIGTGSAICHKRNASVIVDGMLIDVGPLVYPAVVDRDIRHVLLTHAHGDHVLGLWHFLHFRTFRDGVKVNVYSDGETLARVQEMLKATIERSNYERLRVEWHEVGERFEIEGKEIWRRRLPHSDEIKSTIYRIGDFAYATDVIDGPENVDFYQGAKVLVHGVGKRENNHTPVEDVIEIAKKARIRKVYLTHYCQKEDLPQDDFEVLKWAEEGEIIRI